MVQSNKFTSFYDSPPLVTASAFDGEPQLVVADAIVTTNESDPLLHESASSPFDPEYNEACEDSSQSSSSHIPLTEEEENRDKARSVGAGVATGVLGTLLLGPFFGVLLGFGAAYCTKKEGALGDSSRAVGDVALLTQKKAEEIDQKHNIVEKSKVATGKAWGKVKEMDKKYNILVKTKDFAIFCFTSVKDFCVRHRVAERAADATGQAASWAAGKLEEANNSNNGSTGSTAAANKS
mmetsp:Transcript_12192/g.15941  ORF Transcript_12192/g.15941 Transcript_12192/m.15941 type:complete len:237 (-) Transcript_12192:83-793(-)|eukprot:CAMPEP_0198151408 /NCGR_PEP_ID=MMETSP1443-20131203/55530_1 /TAXON_ID=186043 /ORGANISM="Entomoneis sp., Strain CCMP2396" /LENGTH=236 /DNA_ID=CAMNT_0043817055 /DNA_START=122 /DNA_END=832 /DNA_ORIENTATION=+